MGIKKTTKVYELNFDFEYLVPNEEDPRSLSLRYHITDEFGQTVSIMDTDSGEVYFSLPALMFQEVNKYLEDEGVFGSTKKDIQDSSTKLSLPNIIKQRSSAPSENKPNINRIAKPINDPKPKISSGAEKIEVTGDEEFTPETPYLPDNSPIESFTNSQQEDPEITKITQDRIALKGKVEPKHSVKRKE